MSGVKRDYEAENSYGKKIAMNNEFCHLHAAVLALHGGGEGYQHNEHQKKNVEPEKTLIHAPEEMELAMMDDPEDGQQQKTLNEVDQVGPIITKIVAQDFIRVTALGRGNGQTENQ